MAIEIVTGHTGKNHVTAADEGAFKAAVVGSGRYVMSGENQFAVEIVSNNLLRIKSGELVNQGRHMRIVPNDYEEVTIENGTQSLKRNDLIAARYAKDTSSSVESVELVVIKGTAGTTAQDPTYISGDILSGATQDDFLLYRVELDGLNIKTVTPLFSIVPGLNDLNEKWNDFSKKHPYDWSAFATEDNTHTWMPVISGGQVFHRNVAATIAQANYWMSGNLRITCIKLSNNIVMYLIKDTEGIVTDITTAAVKGYVSREYTMPIPETTKAILYANSYVENKITWDSVEFKIHSISTTQIKTHFWSQNRYENLTAYWYLMLIAAI